MYTPSKLDLQFFAAEQRLSDDMALRFWEYANSQQWRMRDGRPMENWRQCFLKWCEVVEAPARGRCQTYITDEERELRRAEAVIMMGRRQQKPDEAIESMLASLGLKWPGAV